MLTQRNKRIFSGALAFLLLLFSLAACKNQGIGADSPSDPAETSKDLPAVSEIEPDDVEYYNHLSKSYDIDSYNMLESVVAYGGELYCARNAHGGAYAQMITALSNGSERLYFPYFWGDEASLDDRNITVFVKEHYGLPWIWYHCTHNDTSVTVKVSYLSVATVDASSITSISELLRSMNHSHVVTVDNYTTYPGIKSVTEVSLKLSDRTVSAFQYERDNDPRYTMEFLYDGMIVRITTWPSILTDNFWSEFSLR